KRVDQRRSVTSASPHAKKIVGRSSFFEAYCFSSSKMIPLQLYSAPLPQMSRVNASVRVKRVCATKVPPAEKRYKRMLVGIHSVVGGEYRAKLFDEEVGCLLLEPGQHLGGRVTAYDRRTPNVVNQVGRVRCARAGAGHRPRPRLRYPGPLRARRVEVGCRCRTFR